MDCLYALMSDNSLRIINLETSIVSEIKDIFISASTVLKPNDIEEDIFTGDIISRKGENIVYVNYKLPDVFNNIPDNQADITSFQIGEDIPKSIFWYQDGKFIFQIFNRRNLLKQKYVLKLLKDNSFDKMSDSAFIVDDKVQVIFENDKLYFQSYTSANLIFPLLDFVEAATNEDIDSFGEIHGIEINTDDVKRISNVKTRRLITVVSKTGNIKTFNSKTVTAKNKLLKKYNINASVDVNGNLVIPTTKVSDLNRALEFLNEDIFTGEITNSRYRANSKKKD